MSNHKKFIYLDYAATSPLCEEARFAIRPYFHTFGSDSIVLRGNANSLYTPGRDASIQLENARKTIAESLCASRPEEIIFTSGATESNFLALSGLFLANRCKTIITTNIEHPSVTRAARFVAQKCNVVELNVDKFGFVQNDELERLIGQCDMPLISIQMANSELASVQNVSHLAKLAKKHNCLIHIDATQALGKVKIDLNEMVVDSASFSSHKIGGPQGVGCLFLRKSVKFSSPIVGGGQESNRRGGTQNVSGQVAFAAALKASVNLVEEENERLSALKKEVVQQVCSLKTSSGNFCRCVVDEDMGKEENSGRLYLPNVATFIIPKVESETVILRLDERGICVSGGSACSSHSQKPSRSLKAVGISDDDANCELRVSFGRYTTKQEIDEFVHALKEVI